MRKYEVLVERTLSWNVHVEAESEEKALEKVRDSFDATEYKEENAQVGYLEANYAEEITE